MIVKLQPAEEIHAAVSYTCRELAQRRLILRAFERPVRLQRQWCGAQAGVLDMLSNRISFNRSNFAGATFAALLLGVAVLGAPSPAAAASRADVTVTIISLKALDKMDDFSQGDFYARITIDGDIQNTAVVKQDVDIKPNWKITKKVNAGDVKVKIEILDKDVSKDDPIDVNRVANKRDLDFTINTKSCRIEGFSSTYRCDTTIKRAGQEAKKAELAFKVSVNK